MYNIFTYLIIHGMRWQISSIAQNYLKIWLFLQRYHNVIVVVKLKFVFIKYF
jgi:hypothetical protein